MKRKELIDILMDWDNDDDTEIMIEIDGVMKDFDIVEGTEDDDGEDVGRFLVIMINEE